ncbi:hypothetical protein [Photobacterium aquimaris]|uniref:Uncharacterized protein n=1 Tax=Photobacterium aquimaris TaxID=512643 RepID=A0A2T3I0H8_9GAMM|nr:hypothetical protein [Photobacterium aquimaris]OBU25582.1 hypothetical protein AYY21_08350 [Photobacterium aquimaris]PQJ37119.1 hypothetical protein BTN98_18435 [Photobacterium aquimaris]PSU10025.1 hypothetical protein C0W81_04700 [Photobacterium aquimaris]
MACELHQSWKIIISLNDSSPNYYLSNKIFNVKASKSFMRKMGGGMENFQLSPDVLSPTAAFHDAILKNVTDLGFSGRTLPYKYKDNEVNIRIHHYFGKYISITLILQKGREVSVDNLIESNKLENNPDLYKLVCTIAGLITDGNLRKFSPKTSIPSISCCQVKSFFESVTDKVLVSSLTGHSHATDNIVSKVVIKNECHQINDALTLVDKQGLLQYIPNSALDNRETKSKFESCSSLFELFSIISKSFHDQYLDNNNLFFSSVDRLVNKSSLVTKSYTSQMTIEVLANTFNISEQLERTSRLLLPKKEEKIQKNKGLFDRFFTEYWGSNDFFTTFIPIVVSIVGATFLAFWAWYKK